MKILHTIQTAVIVGLLSVPLGVVIAQDSVHVGERILSKDQVINMLQPEAEDPEIKTRGLRFKNPAASPPKPRSISMNINFAFDSYELTEQAQQQLQPIGEALNSDQLLRLNFVLEGHTDALGTEEYNMALSQKRADAVKQYLASNFNINPDRLAAIGRGEQQLLIQSKPEDGRNRRVSVSTVIH